MRWNLSTTRQHNFIFRRRNFRSTRCSSGHGKTDEKPMPMYGYSNLKYTPGVGLELTGREREFVTDPPITELDMASDYEKPDHQETLRVCGGIRNKDLVDSFNESIAGCYLERLQRNPIIIIALFDVIVGRGLYRPRATKTLDAPSILEQREPSEPRKWEVDTESSGGDDRDSESESDEGDEVGESNGLDDEDHQSAMDNEIVAVVAGLSTG